MRARSLHLRREALGELSTTELVSVAGGAYELTHATCTVTDRCTTGPQTDTCPTLPLQWCLEIRTLRSCPTF